MQNPIFVILFRLTTSMPCLEMPESSPLTPVSPASKNAWSQRSKKFTLFLKALKMQKKRWGNFAKNTREIERCLYLSTFVGEGTHTWVIILHHYPFAVESLAKQFCVVAKRPKAQPRIWKCPDQVLPLAKWSSLAGIQAVTTRAMQVTTKWSWQNCIGAEKH